MRGIVFEDVYVPLYNGLTFGEGENVAGLSNSLANLATGNTDFENNFYNGKKEYEQKLNQVKERHPILTILEEAASGGLTGGAIAKLLKSGLGIRKILQSIDKKQYPHRSREQWKKDLEYGKKEFNKLRGQSPLKREGQPDVYVTGNTSWSKIRQGNRREKYEMLQDVPDIYSTGTHYARPRIKQRADNFDNFHWFEKNNKGIQIGESKTGRTLYNVNPNIKRYLLEHPEKATEWGIDVTKL